MNEEIELKFIVQSETLTTLRQRLSATSHDDHALQQLTNFTYFETDGFDLRHHSIGLRIRQVNGQCENVMNTYQLFELRAAKGSDMVMCGSLQTFSIMVPNTECIKLPDNWRIHDMKYTPVGIDIAKYLMQVHFIDEQSRSRSSVMRCWNTSAIVNLA